MRFDTIPLVLKDEGLWCCWRYEERNGKHTKIPHNPRTGGRAQSNNQQTFGRFSVAQDAYRRGGYDGLGLGVFPPVAAIDIDNCVTDDGEISAMALDIIEMCHSYTEYSPSGHGVRILLTVPNGFVYDKQEYYINNQARGLEVYVSGNTQKFVTVTGNVIEAAPVADGTQVLQEVCKKYMRRNREKAQKHQPRPVNGCKYPCDDILSVGMERDPQLANYWRGSFPMENESERDAALMARLLYWLDGDIDRAIRYFMESPFVAGKDEHHRRKLERDDYLHRTAENVMPERTAHDDRDEYRRRLIQAAPVHVNTDGGLVERLKQMQPAKNYSWDDKGMGNLFADVFRDKCRFNSTAKEWYFYNGSVWAIDAGAMHVARMAKDLADALVIYCTTIQDEREKTDYLKIAVKYGQLRCRETMIKDARDRHYISQADLDGNLNLFNCQNGTYNLRTGEFGPHNPNDLLSKISNVIYDPLAKAPTFEKFVSDVMQDDASKILYLQKIFGYALTGDTELETCWFLYGSTTRNGKSTLVETIAHMMGGSGGYACAMSPQSLAQRQNKDTRQASGDIARLDGCRFLNASEPPKRMLFDVALLKTLLGRDSITARHLYEREFEFVPRFKLVINTNYLPLIQDDTLFSSGRVNVITFDRHFEPQEQDRGLKDKLKNPAEISGIFNWCIEGLKLYRELGADPPASVLNATAEYRQNSDKTGNFISECLKPSEKNCSAGEVYMRYAKWCEENGYGTESKRNFWDELQAKGLFAKSGTIDGVTVHNIVRGHEIIYETDLSHSPAGARQVC